MWVHSCISTYMYMYMYVWMYGDTHVYICICVCEINFLSQKTCTFFIYIWIIIVLSRYCDFLLKVPKYNLHSYHKYFLNTWYVPSHLGGLGDTDEENGYHLVPRVPTVHTYQSATIKPSTAHWSQAWLNDELGLWTVSSKFFSNKKHLPFPKRVLLEPWLKETNGDLFCV